MLGKLRSIQNLVIANEMKQSSMVVIQEHLDCGVLPRFARSFGTLLDRIYRSFPGQHIAPVSRATTQDRSG